MRGALVGGDILFYGSDSFYHMRRILYTVDHFPSTLWFDPSINYPEGLELLWPPLFDQPWRGPPSSWGRDLRGRWRWSPPSPPRSWGL